MLELLAQAYQRFKPDVPGYVVSVPTLYHSRPQILSMTIIAGFADGRARLLEGSPCDI